MKMSEYSDDACKGYTYMEMRTLTGIRKLSRKYKHVRLEVFTLMIEAAKSSETLVSYYITTRPHENIQSRRM
jgi:hypothetical protein